MQLTIEAPNGAMIGDALRMRPPSAASTESDDDPEPTAIVSGNWTAGALTVRPGVIGSDPLS